MPLHKEYTQETSAILDMHAFINSINVVTEQLSYHKVMPFLQITSLVSFYLQPFDFHACQCIFQPIISLITDN